MLSYNPIFLKNLIRLCNDDSLKMMIINVPSSGNFSVVRDSEGNLYPIRSGASYFETNDVRQEAKQIAESLKQYPENSIVGLFGIGFTYVLDYLKGSTLKICIFEPDLEALNASFKELEIPQGITVKFVSSVKEFVSYSLSNIVVNDLSRRLFPVLYREMEELLNSSTKSETECRYEVMESSIRVLTQARGNIFGDRGGDTVALERTTEALRKLGVDVVIDCSGQLSPRDFDLVHLYNFATPYCIEPFARRAFEEDVPFVATTLYEDRPAFFAKMSIYGRVLEEYMGGKLSHISFRKVKEIIENNIDTFSDRGYLDNNFVANNATILLASGSVESELIKKDYPEFNRVEVVPFGFQPLPDADPNLFRVNYGLNDYILCVGRIEWRKNQAMLVKALENSPLDIVFVGGKVADPPHYAKMIPSFRRAGRNIVVSGLSMEELSSAYRGAKAHVLPSWYELPGLVSLEAASCGVPVVGTRYGTLHDYLGDDAFYCDPGDINSIREAVEKAVEVGPHSHVRSNLINSASRFSWDRTAERILQLYKEVVSGESKQSYAENRFGGMP